MAEKLKILQGQEIKTRTYPKNDGSQGTLTVFAAMAGGVLLAKCEVFGDKVAELTELMNSGKELEIESKEHKPKFDTWNIKLPGGFGGGWKGGNKGGGWSPKYRGKTIPEDVFSAVSARVLQRSVVAIRQAFSDLGVNVTPDIAGTIIAEARSMVAQFWMAVEENVTAVAGYEGPAPVAATASPATTTGASAAPPANHSNGNGSIDGWDAIADGWRDELFLMDSAEAVDNAMKMFREDKGMGVAVRTELLRLAMNRKRELAMSHAA